MSDMLTRQTAFKMLSIWIKKHYPHKSYVNALSIKWVVEFAIYYNEQVNGSDTK